MESPFKPSDMQIGGDHYKDMAIQVTYFTHVNKLDGLQHNVIKYVCRYKKKGGREDLLKARHYIDLMIEYNYGDENGNAGTERRVLPEVSRQSASEEAAGRSQPSTPGCGEGGESLEGRREGSGPQTSLEQRGFDRPIQHPSDFEKEEPFLPTG